MIMTWLLHRTSYAAGVVAGVNDIGNDLLSEINSTEAASP
jgi:hypothetical protein